MGDRQTELREDLEGANRLLQVLVLAQAEGDSKDVMTPAWRREHAIQDVKERIAEITEEMEECQKT